MSSSDKWDDDGYVLAWYITYLPLVALLFAIERLYVRSLPDSPWWALVWILAIPFAFEAVFEKTSEKLIYKVDKCLSGLTMPQFRKATLSIVFSIGFFLLIYPPYRYTHSKDHNQYDFLWSPPDGSEISTSQLVVTELAVLFAAAIFWFITSPNSDK